MRPPFGHPAAAGYHLRAIVRSIATDEAEKVFGQDSDFAAMLADAAADRSRSDGCLDRLRSSLRALYYSGHDDQAPTK